MKLDSKVGFGTVWMTVSVVFNICIFFFFKKLNIWNKLTVKKYFPRKSKLYTKLLEVRALRMKNVNGKSKRQRRKLSFRD